VGSYRKSFEVSLSDIDFNGHVRSTRYLEYSANVRYSHLAEQGWDIRRLATSGFGVVSLSEEVRYHRELVLGDSVEVAYQVSGYSADGSRWRAEVTVRKPDGAVAATVTTTGAWLGLRTRRIEAPPPELVATTDAIRSADFVVL
jgi:acyl-CoA thioester hydrolase